MDRLETVVGQREVLEKGQETECPAGESRQLVTVEGEPAETGCLSPDGRIKSGDDIRGEIAEGE